MVLREKVTQIFFPPPRLRRSFSPKRSADSSHGPLGHLPLAPSSSLSDANRAHERHVFGRRSTPRSNFEVSDDLWHSGKLRQPPGIESPCFKKSKNLKLTHPYYPPIPWPRRRPHRRQQAKRSGSSALLPLPGRRRGRRARQAGVRRACAAPPPSRPPPARAPRPRPWPVAAALRVPGLTLRARARGARGSFA